MERLLNKRPSPATVIACLALAVALGETSYAAADKLLPKNSVGTKQVVNGSLQTIDLSTKAKRALKGARGPQGLQGPQGVQWSTLLKPIGTLVFGGSCSPSSPLPTDVTAPSSRPASSTSSACAAPAGPTGLATTGAPRRRSSSFRRGSVTVFGRESSTRAKCG